MICRFSAVVDRLMLLQLYTSLRAALLTSAFGVLICIYSLTQTRLNCSGLIRLHICAIASRLHDCLYRPVCHQASDLGVWFDAELSVRADVSRVALASTICADYMPFVSNSAVMSQQHFYQYLCCCTWTTVMLYSQVFQHRHWYLYRESYVQ